MTNALTVLGSSGFKYRRLPPRVAIERGLKVDWSEVLAFLDTIQVGDVYEITLPEQTNIKSFRVVVSRFGSEKKKKFSILTTTNEEGDEVIEIIRRR